MEAPFQLLQQTRKNILKRLDSYSLDQLNAFPTGFRNTLFWHVAHVWVTQQLLCYGRSGQPLKVPEAIVAGYRKGTVPEQPADAETWTMVQEKLITSVDDMWIDYQAGHFAQYNSYATSYGTELNNIEEAVSFNNVHEAMHLGYILSMARMV